MSIPIITLFYFPFLIIFLFIMIKNLYIYAVINAEFDFRICLKALFLYLFSYIILYQSLSACLYKVLTSVVHGKKLLRFKSFNWSA